MNAESLTAHQRQATDFQAEGFFSRLYKLLPKMKTVDPNEDPEFHARVRHVLRPKESLMQFIARTGLGRPQAVAMSRDEITRFVENADANNLAAGVATKLGERIVIRMDPQPRPRNFVITE
ncbi:MAG TPA: hypothetical protein VEJ46_14025 [Candidatus Acidoferrum sp.]|nr:hypothetical protein [Candidatus Acidoferrum sp.]